MLSVLTRNLQANLQKLYRKLMNKVRVERIEAEHPPKGLRAKTVQNINQVMGFQLTIGDLQPFHSHTGAMVGGTLAGGQQIFQHKDILNSAQAISQAAARRDLISRSNASSTCSWGSTLIANSIGSSY